MSSVKFLDFALNQLPHETTDQIVMVGLMNVWYVINHYLPIEMVRPANKATFALCLSKIGQPHLSMDALVDQMFDFLSDKEDIQTALKWLQSQYIQIDQNLRYMLTNQQKD